VTPADNHLVFDTGPLRHFATEGWLGVLKFLTRDRQAVIPESVERELKNQLDEVPALAQVLASDWIHVDRSTDMGFLMAFASYEQRLVVGGRNRGECGVLALGRTRGYEVVLDDATARTIAEEDKLKVTATLPLLCAAIRDKQLTVPMVQSLADDLISGQYFLPFEQGGFRRWAYQEGLIDYE
jgi:predicted nucleic acid-binding protein